MASSHKKTLSTERRNLPVLLRLEQDPNISQGCQ